MMESLGSLFAGQRAEPEAPAEEPISLPRAEYIPPDLPSTEGFQERIAESGAATDARFDQMLQMLEGPDFQVADLSDKEKADLRNSMIFQSMAQALPYFQESTGLGLLALGIGAQAGAAGAGEAVRAREEALQDRRLQIEGMKIDTELARQQAAQQNQLMAVQMMGIDADYALQDAQMQYQNSLANAEAAYREMALGVERERLQMDKRRVVTVGDGLAMLAPDGSLERIELDYGSLAANALMGSQETARVQIAQTLEDTTVGLANGTVSPAEAYIEFSKIVAVDPIRPAMFSYMNSIERNLGRRVDRDAVNAAKMVSNDPASPEYQLEYTARLIEGLTKAWTAHPDEMTEALLGASSAYGLTPLGLMSQPAAPMPER